MRGDCQLHQLVVQWIIVPEKLRDAKSLFESAEVTSSWHRATTTDGNIQLTYDGVRVDPLNADQL